MTFQRLKSLQADHLTPLENTLQDMLANATPTQKSVIEHAHAQVTNSIEMLRPFSELYSSEQIIRSMKVLLAEDDRKQQVVAKLALSGTGVQLDVVTNAEQIKEFYQVGLRYDIIFISSKLSHLIPILYEKFPSAKLVMMASTRIADDIPGLKQFAANLSTIVSRHAEDRTFTVKNVATTAGKLAAKDLFGLEKYMNWGVEVQSRQVAIFGPIEADRGHAKHLSRLGVRIQICTRAAPRLRRTPHERDLRCSPWFRRQKRSITICPERNPFSSRLRSTRNFASPVTGCWPPSPFPIRSAALN